MIQVIRASSNFCIKVISNFLKHPDPKKVLLKLTMHAAHLGLISIVHLGVTYGAHIGVRIYLLMQADV